jgi:hypothetical protein
LQNSPDPPKEGLVTRLANALSTSKEMDVIFKKVTGWKGVFTIVKQAEVEPLLLLAHQEE